MADVRKEQTDDLGPNRDAALQGVTQVCGALDASGFRFGVVASRFNPALVEPLLVSAVQALRAYGAAADRITVVRVPGAFEIPTALAGLQAQLACDALIGLGVVLHGETPHATMINQQVSAAFRELAVQWKTPVIDGVVVANTLEQAEVRCCSGEASRGWYAAKAAIEMATVMRQLKA
jgi:6,7-dimethyl-8-ribityllumazine synthase